MFSILPQSCIHVSTNVMTAIVDIGNYGHDTNVKRYFTINNCLFRTHMALLSFINLGQKKNMCVSDFMGLQNRVGRS